MKVGFVVDGVAEYRSLPLLFPQLTDLTGNEFSRVLKADLQPYAPYGAMARSCRARLVELEGRGVDRAVILVDREGRTECCGQHAAALWAQARRYVSCEVHVVVKDRTFENWLISDLLALAKHPQRFRVTPAARKAVMPNKADGVDGVQLLQRLAKRGYEKVQDGQVILAGAEVGRLGQHSRSFRRFLRIVGFAVYTSQSRRPANK